MDSFAPGTAVRYWKPRHAEHGSVGVVISSAWPVLIRVRWARPAPHLPDVCPPDALRSEAEYQAAKRESPAGWAWA